MSGIEMVFTITKEAAKLIRAGNAFLSKGGVRLLDGTLFELAKPVSTSVLSQINPVITGVNVLSSLGSNVQCAFIQKGVNAANVKLDSVIKQLTSISDAMQGLKAINALSWVNAGFGLANCCISAVGFRKTLNSLEEVHGQIHEFFDRYKEDRQNDIIRDYRVIMMNLKTDLNFIQGLYNAQDSARQSFFDRESHIEEHLNLARNFLSQVIDDFKQHRLDGQVGCQIIFTLTPVFVQTLNEYCCWYFYFHGEKHGCRQDWFSIFDEVNSPAFRTFMKEHLFLDTAYVAVSPKAKRDAFKVAFEGIEQQKSRIETCDQLIETMPMEDYIRIDDVLNQQLIEAIETQYMSCSNESVDDYLRQSIANEDYRETDDGQILISVVAQA